MHKVGLVVNPIAGMGGKVGLKGTDGKAEEAARLGAVPVAHARTGSFLTHLGRAADRFEWVTCTGAMGGAILEEMGLEQRAIYAPGEPTGPDDTISACRAFVKEGCELIIFCGGDGTARNVFEAVGTSVPILGIPSGVKMLSGVFALNPAAAAEMMELYARGTTKIKEVEVVDLDEEKYRHDVFAFRLFGIAHTIFEGNFIQSSKMVVEGQDEEEMKTDIARTFIEDMEKGTLYLLGAGTTVKAISRELGIERTTLGIDAVVDGALLEKDVNEAAILSLLERYGDVKAVLSPIGAQGFVIGRGNQQLSPAVIRRIGLENIIVVSTPAKLKTISRLLVDTGDEVLDKLFSEKRYLPVIIGYRTTTIKNIQLQNF